MNGVSSSIKTNNEKTLAKYLLFQAILYNQQIKRGSSRYFLQILIPLDYQNSTALFDD